MKIIAWLAVACALTANSACGVIGPSCVDRQRRGTAGVTRGEVAAGQISVHQISYDLQGSQNDVEVSWPSSTTTTMPRLEVYATRAACNDFTLPAASNVGDCRVIAVAALQPGRPTATLIVTHGRGNPEILGSPAEYKLWVVGDAAQAVSYTITATWFRGPDC